MFRYACLRVLGAIPTLFLVITAAFLMVHAAPGGPFDSERALPPDIAANIEAAYHLDESLPEQFLRYLRGLVRGDLGPSYRYRDYRVAEIIGSAFPQSMRLGAFSMFLALVVGVTLGAWSALRRNTWLDRVLSGIAMVGISIPTFVIAPLMLLVFAVHFGWLPASFVSNDGVARFILPVIALALPQIAYITRLTRASLIEVMQSDYIRTARAQGLKPASIIQYHAIKPTMLPLLSYLGPAIGAVLMGSVAVEQVFGIPGLGQFLISGAVNRDYPLVLGITILYATIVITLNLIVDLMYGFIDPRTRAR